MKRIGFLSVAFAAMLTVACGGNDRRDANDLNNDNPTVGTAGDANREADRDNRNTMMPGEPADFVEKAAIAGMTEVQLGKMAAEKGSMNEVKQFGQRMVTDHSKAGDELKQIASRHNIQVPAELDEDHRELVDRLSKLQGTEFDREYMDAMVSSHEDVVDLLEGRANEQADADEPVAADVNQWASKTLPTTKDHLEQAKRIKDQLGRRTTH